MDAITYSAARKKLVETMERVCDNHEPIIVTRRNARPVVMMSLDDFNAIEETAYLLRNPANAAWLRESIAQAMGGRTEVRELVEP
ncbi:MAG: hypothetical protein A2051_01205 [Desulfovibrionales bacterium GWA2_65_9]|nr:MAG: hypothetical protein A2051_01205 [Desulfovibrionales bacterium GWA2_65_9]